MVRSEGSEGILEPLVGTVVRAFRPTPVKALCEAATRDPAAWQPRRPLRKQTAAHSSSNESSDGSDAADVRNRFERDPTIRLVIVTSGMS